MSGEHEQKETLRIDIFEPDHVKRTESAVFTATKRAMKATGATYCAICHSELEIEYHHRFVEWCYTNAIDWRLWRAMMLDPSLLIRIRSYAGMDGIRPKWQVKTVPATETMIFRIGKLVASEGFDWNSFNPDNPEEFVDSRYNIEPICKLHHIRDDHGIHLVPLPIWFAQGLVRPDFEMSPDEAQTKGESHA